MTRWILLLMLGGLLMALGCDTTGDDDDDVSDDDVSDDDDTGDDDTADGCAAEDPPCVDDLILDLSLHDDKVSEGGVQNTADGDDIVSVVDATAGGFSMATENPFVYLRFEDDGLV